MKKVVFTLLCIGCVHNLVAQNDVIEAEIRKLEQQEVQAVLQKDTVVLLKLWDKGYVVNAPDNKINFAGKTTLDRPVLSRSRATFTRDVEEIIIRGNTAFSMGSETVLLTEDQTTSQQPIKRRYTNIWMKQEGGWKLMARHANILCPSR